MPSKERVIRPLEECLPLDRTTGQITFGAILFDLRQMSLKRIPSADLDVIQFGDSPAKIIPTIPLKVSSRVWIDTGVGQKRVLFRHMSFVIWHPSLLPPLSEGLSGSDMEGIQLRVGPLGREFASFQGRQEPLLGKLQETVVQILSLKDTEFQHLGRCKGRLKLRRESLSWVFGEGISVSLLESVMDTNNGAFPIGGLRVALFFQDASHHIGGGEGQCTFVFEMHGVGVVCYFGRRKN